jgi:uncharacterized membrane protein
VVPPDPPPAAASKPGLPQAPAGALPLPRAVRVVTGVLAFGVAAYAAIGYGLVPIGDLVHPDMRAGFQLRAGWVRAHVFASMVALLLGPFQFAAGLRARRPALHRWMGRAYLGVGVGLGGVSGFVLAQYAYGGAGARWGFGLLALAWLSTGALALRAVLRGEIAAHRRWMLRNFALSLAAVTLRIYVPSSMLAGAPFETAYAAIAWLCWVPNLVLAELLVRRWQRRGPVVTAGAYRSS